MIYHVIPYEFIERFINVDAASNLNQTILIISAIGLICAIILCRRINFKIRKKSDNHNLPDHQEDTSPTYPSLHGKWSPTGWLYDEEKQRWEPPDYLTEESRKKWRWDPEKQIWIDRDKEFRLQRYRENRKSMGLKPTYEEWKASKLASEQHPHQIEDTK